MGTKGILDAFETFSYVVRFKAMFLSLMKPQHIPTKLIAVILAEWNAIVSL